MAALLFNSLDHALAVPIDLEDALARVLWQTIATLKLQGRVGLLMLPS